MDEPLEKLAPIASSDKIEQVLGALQHLIIDGNLQPGTELPAERELAAQLQVSRFSLREALRAAQAQGLIEIKRGKRPTVTVPSATAAVEVMGLTLRRSRRPLIDLIVARQGLECQIVRLAALKAEDRHITEMEKTIETMRNNRDNLTLCSEKDVEFHNLLLEASANVVFEIMLAPVAELLRKSRIATMKYQGIDRAITGHAEILDAVKNHDPDEAFAAMSRHLEMAEADLKNIEEMKK